jgi:hypothetical protein
MFVYLFVFFFLFSVHSLMRLLYLFILIVVVIAKQQSSRYQYNELNSINICPFDQDFSPALFPDSSVLLDNHQKKSKKVKKKLATSFTTKTTTVTATNIATKKSKKHLVSFEEWQKKQGEQDERTYHKRKGDVGNAKKKQQQQQIIDSLDGGFGDDFGAMFEGFLKSQKKDDVASNVNIIEPITTERQRPQLKDNSIKSLKERFNYASNDCAATVRKANKEAKGANNILYESKDQYMINKCSADKFVIINLCEPIRVDTIVMANFEFFSSTFKDFRVYVADRYPSNDWQLLGQWRARNTRDLQVSDR